VTEADAYNSITTKLSERYGLTEKEVAVGWPDYNLAMHAERINKLNSIFLTGLDLLDDLDEFKVCTGYERTLEEGDTRPNKIRGIIPATIKEFGELRAVNETMPGWNQDLRQE
jgi:adenylosuccinate synthase